MPEVQVTNPWRDRIIRQIESAVALRDTVYVKTPNEVRIWDETAKFMKTRETEAPDDVRNYLQKLIANPNLDTAMGERKRIIEEEINTLNSKYPPPPQASG